MYPLSIKMTILSSSSWCWWYHNLNRLQSKYNIIIMIIIIIIIDLINNVLANNNNNIQRLLSSSSTTPVIGNNYYPHPHHYQQQQQQRTQPLSSSSLYYNHHRHQDNNPKINFENQYKESINEIRTIFLKQHYNFDAFFRHVLTISHSDFHRMFSDTYGILYDRHSFIFNQMFRNLEHYYNDGQLDLTIAMKEFFNLLYKKMFEELNAQYSFDSNYLNCTVEHMEEMMPFGELPQKLIVQVRRSFVAVRTFVQALRYGSDILKTIMELSISSTCENRLQSLSYCYRCDSNSHSSTANNNNNNICQSTCIDQLEKCCLQCLGSLNKEWNKFLNDMIRLSSRLKTSFNIEHIVSPIHIQISDAIMNFQENGRTISQRLFNKCGRPVHRKREKRNDNLSMNHYQQQQQYPRIINTMTNHPQQQQQQRQQQSPLSLSSQPQQQQQQNIDSIIDSMINEFKTFKNFWSNLPRKLCSHYSTEANCLTNQTFRNSDEPNYRDRNNVEIINQQIATLRLISFNLNKAYNGLDVDFENNFDTDNDDTPPIDDEISDDASGNNESSGDDGGGSGFAGIDDSSSSIIDNEQTNKNPIYQHNDDRSRTNQSSSSSNNDINFDTSTESSTTTTTMTKIITLDVTKTSSGFSHLNNRPIDNNLQLLIIIITSISMIFL